MAESAGPETDWGWEGDDPRTAQAAHLSDLHQLELVCAELEVVAGPDAGARVALGSAGLVIGSGRACDLRLTDNQISRRHVELRAEALGVRVSDLGSLNGTYLGGARIERALLTQDAVLSLGSATLAVRFAAEPMRLALSPRRQFGHAVGASESMRHVFALLERAAQTDITVLLEGDSGTGKDVLAVSLHEQSPRAEGPLVVVDCAALPENLVESELFGHERGAFTGAINARAGAFEQAHGGTLFLDEVGELPLAAQPKLLRALENRSFRRVGGTKNIEVDVRVVAATNRGLAEAVRANTFRQDLYYRLSVVNVKVPPLAERPEDIPLLADLFLRKARPGSRLPAELLQLLSSYAWPGNARELRNVIDRFATFDRTDPELLFDHPVTATESDGDWVPRERLLGLPYHEAKRELLEAYHRSVLPRVIQDAGSVAAAAERLELPKASLYRMLRQMKADVPDE